MSWQCREESVDGFRSGRRVQYLSMRENWYQVKPESREFDEFAEEDSLVDGFAAG